MKIPSGSVPSLLGVVVAALALSGCAHNALYFGTRNSIGAEIYGTTTAPTQVSVSYQRSELALIPAKADGGTHSVFGSMDYDFSWFDGLALAQVFATGDAAVAAAGTDNFETEVSGGTVGVKRKRDATSMADGTNQGGRLFFATNTKMGLSLDLGQSVGQSVPSFLFGYRREEATIVPIADSRQEVNSVFADLSIVINRGGKVRDQSTAAHPRDPIPGDRLPGSADGVRIKQRFATGRAALLVATTDENREKLAGKPTTTKEAIDDLTANGALRNRAMKITDAAQRDELLKTLVKSHPSAAKWDWNFFLTSGFTKLNQADRDGLRGLLPP